MVRSRAVMHTSLVPRRALAAALVLGALAVAPRALAEEPSVARVEAPPPNATSASASAQPEPEGGGISNTPMVVGGAALGLTGLGAAGLGVYLTLQGSTISCVSCEGSSDDAPLVAGGLSAILLGLGMASSGAMLVVLGARDEPRGLRVRTIRVGAGEASFSGEF